MSEIKEPNISYDASFQSTEEKELPIKGNDKSSPDLKTLTLNRMSQDTNEADKDPDLLTQCNDAEVVNVTLPNTSALSSEILAQESIGNTGSVVIPGATTAIIDPETVVTRVSDDVPINSLSDSSRTVSLTNENTSTPPSAQVVDSVTNTMVVETISSEAAATPTTAMVGQMTLLDSTESASSGTSMVLSQIPADAGGHTTKTKPPKVTTIDNVTTIPANNAVVSSNDNSNINNNTPITTTISTTTTNNSTITTTTANNTNNNDPTSTDGTVASSAILNHGGSSDGSSPTARISPATGAAPTITSSTTASPSGTPPLNSTGSSCGVGNTNNGSPPSSGGTHSPPNPQHVVLVHIQPGEIFAVRVGDQVQHIRGPATVRMVSNNGPPLPMPMQVAPGHMVQQIVDEHGILTNVILAPQMPGMPPGTPMTGGPNNAPHYYNPYSSHFPTPHPQYPPHHHGHHGAASHMHPGVTGHPHMHGTPPPHTCNSLAPPVHAAGPSPPINSVEERNRQRPWYGKSKSRKPEDGYYYRAPPRRNKSNKSTNSADKYELATTGYENSYAWNKIIFSDETRMELHSNKREFVRRPPGKRNDPCYTMKTIKFGDKFELATTGYENSLTISVNGDVHQQNNNNNVATNPTISSTENGAEQEEEGKILQQPTSILPEPKLTEELLKKIVPQCQVKDVEPRSASIDLAPPDCGENEYDLLFELLLSEKGREFKYKPVYTGVSRVINLKDLKPASEYFLRACTMIEDIKGSLSDPISFKTLSCEPDPPQHPKLSNKTKTSLTLKWNAACENGSKISTYSLEYDQGLNDGQFVEVYNALAKQTRIQQLQAGTKYTFRLAAINNNGKSQFSEPVSFHTSGCVPSQPENPKLDKAFINSLVLSWMKQTNDEIFVLQMDDESTGYGFRITYNGSNTTYQVVELRRNTEYKFRLAAKNDEGQSKWSDIVSYRTLPAPPGPPSKPQVKGKTHACHFKVTWDPPKDDGGSKVSSYHVQIDDGSGFHDIYKGSETECSCDGLTPGHTYSVQVACYGPGGESQFSDSCIVTTPPVVPGTCQAPKLQGKPKAKSLNLRWGVPENDGGSMVTEYIVQMVSPDNTAREVYKGRDTECVVAGLLPGRPYLFQVKCANKIGAGPWSESLEVVSGPGVPDAPKLPTANCKSPHCIQVIWEKPVNNGATITDYRLEWQHKEDADFTQLHVGPQRKFEAKNLTPATKYSFRVLAINSAGPSPYSPVCQCQTPPSSPAAVVHYRVHSTATDVLLKWDEPHSNGSEIISYNIDIGDKSLINISSASEYRISNLSPDTAYRIRIQAVNAIGPGAFSTSIKVITKSLPPPPPSLECVSTAHNSLKLKWGDGRNPDLISYQLELGKDDKNFQQVYSGSAHVHKVGKLSELTSYDFRILAINEAGCGEYSDIYKFATNKAPPPPLKAPKVSEITTNSCMVEWQGCKQMGVDSVIYQLQVLCIGKGEHEHKSVYRGPETSFSVQNLSSRCEYQMRVGAIRICSDGLPDVTGAFSPGTPFTTLSPEPIRPVESRPPTVMKLTKSKQLTDQQISILFLFGFGVIAIFLAVVAQYLLAYTSGEG